MDFPRVQLRATVIGLVLTRLEFCGVADTIGGEFAEAGEDDESVWEFLITG